jgi:hypothetical protein
LLTASPRTVKQLSLNLAVSAASLRLTARVPEIYNPPPISGFDLTARRERGA